MEIAYDMGNELDRLRKAIVDHSSIVTQTLNLTKEDKTRAKKEFSNFLEIVEALREINPNLLLQKITNVNSFLIDRLDLISFILL